MNLEAYRSETTTVPWTLAVKPERVIAQIAVKEAVHQIIGRTIMLNGRLPRLFNAAINDALPSEQRKKITEQARRIDTYLIRGAGEEPRSEDVRRVFSQVFHLWNPDDAVGAESRHALQAALGALGLGKELPAEDMFPPITNVVAKTDPPRSRG